MIEDYIAQQSSWITSGQIIQLLTIVMLVLVGGAVLWLHWQIEVLRQNSTKLPALSEKLANTLLAAQQGLQKLQQQMASDQPQVAKQLKELGQLKQDLKFLTERAENTIAKLEKVKLSKAEVSLPEPKAAYQTNKPSQTELSLPLGEDLEAKIIQSRLEQVEKNLKASGALIEETPSQSKIPQTKATQAEVKVETQVEAKVTETQTISRPTVQRVIQKPAAGDVWPTVSVQEMEKSQQNVQEPMQVTRPVSMLEQALQQHLGRK